MEKAQLIFLGTSCSTPTKDRNLGAIALKYKGHLMLFDCAEGTQRQMMKAKVSYMRINQIFLSHFHGDHILGLPGLLATMSLHLRDEPLFIYGPKGVEFHVKKALELSMLNVNYEVKCIEVRQGKVIENDDFMISAVRLKHDVPCFGYVFQETGSKGEFMRKKAEKLGIPVGPLYAKLKDGHTVEVNGKKFTPEMVMDYSKAKKGKKISLVFDTMPNECYFDAIADSDLLVHESSFLEKDAQRACETRHSTAREVGKVAAITHCKKLVLTHISPRYKDNEPFENEARMEFNDVTVAKDLMEMEI